MTQPTRANLLRPLLRDTAVALAVPAALGYSVGSPLSLRVPNTDMLAVWWNTIQADPTEIIHPLLTTLIYVLWIGWAWHAMWTATALLWLTLHLPALALPTALRRLTPAAAVQALALGSMLTTQSAHAATVTATSTVHTHTAPQAAHRLTGHHPRRGQPTTTSTYTVRPGDTLWGIAEQQLGHGQDWPAVYDENEDVPQATGGELTNPTTIEPGWSLTIPATPDDAAATKAPVTPIPPPPAVAAHTAPHPADTRRKPAAVPAPITAPTTAHNAARPHPARTAPAAPAPRTATAAVPHTAGWTLPNGYLGITLLSVIAASCAALLRARTKTGNVPEIPRAIKQLASVARRAHSAAAYGYLPEEQTPGATPPPHFTPLFGTPILGVSPEPHREVTYEPERLKILALDGPGAQGAATALALSLLAADPATPPYPGLEPATVNKPRAFRIVTDLSLAQELLGPIDDPGDPQWLLIAPTAATALRATALPAPGSDTLTPTDRTMTTVLLTKGADADLASIAATTGTAHHPVSVIVLGKSASATPPETQPATHAHIAGDGHVTDIRGPAAAQFTGLRLQILTRDLACEIYRVLHNARAPHHQDGHTAEPASAASDDDSTPALHVPAQARGEETPGPGLDNEPNAPPMMLRLLGSIEIHGPEGTIPVTGDKTAALLALLALHPRGRTIAQIADQAWDGLDTTGTDATPIRSAIARARTLLRTACDEKPPGAELITAGSTGFRLNPRWITTDLAALDHAERAARETTNPVERGELLRHAAALCRGELAETIDDWDRHWLTAARAAYDQQATALAFELTEVDASTANRHLARLAAAV